MTIFCGSDGDGLYFVCDSFFSNILHDMDAQCFVENMVKSVKAHLIFAAESCDILADFVGKLEMFIYDFFVSLGENVVGVVIDFLVEDAHLVRLLFCQGKIFDILKYCHFLFPENEGFL